MYHILSLDGGSIRGALTAKLLERLEAPHLIDVMIEVRSYYKPSEDNAPL